MHGSTLPVWIIVLIVVVAVLFITGLFGTYVSRNARKRFHEGGSKKIIVGTVNPLLIAVVSSFSAISIGSLYLVDFFGTLDLDNVGFGVVFGAILAVFVTIIVVMVLCITLVLIYIFGSVIRCMLIKKYYKRHYGIDVDITTSM